MTPQLERWEYWTCFLEADAERARQFLDAELHWQHMPKYAVEALIPKLNEYGQAGWELIELRPVGIGEHHDVLLSKDNLISVAGATWSHVYLCAFKRRLP